MLNWGRLSFKDTPRLVNIIIVLVDSTMVKDKVLKDARISDWLITSHVTKIMRSDWLIVTYQEELILPALDGL